MFLKLPDTTEWEHSQTLQIVGWILLLGWFLEFSTWSKFTDFTINAVESGRHLCWPFFQSCGDWYFLSQFPLFNSHGLVYAVLFGLVILAAHALITKQFQRAQILFLIFFAWEVTVMLMSFRLAVNFWYFHLLYAALFIFASYQKVLYLRLGAVLLYFFSGTLKLTDAWLQGAYFTALAEGLYFVPEKLIPVATNFVIILEICFSWLLLFSSKQIRYPALALFIFFHLYSVVYVGYTYPTVALPIVIALFLVDEKNRFDIRTVVKGWAGAVILAFFIVVHLVPFFIEGNKHLTGEGNKFGMYMFEANYQCDAQIVTTYSDGIVTEDQSSTSFANRRCDPYAYFFYFKNYLCTEAGVASIAWTHDVSINGDPFLRIVDVENACALEYQPFTHNEWIRLPGKDTIEVIAPVEKNRYPIPTI